MKYLEILAKAQDYSNSVTQQDAYNRMEYYKAGKNQATKGGNGFAKKKRSTYDNIKNISTNDVANLIRTMVPEILEIFLTSSAIRVNSKDPEEKRQLEEYIQKNIFNNSTYVIAQTKAVKAGCIFNKGIIKITLDERVDRTATPIMNDEEMLSTIAEKENGSNLKIIQHKEKMFRVEETELEKIPEFHYINFDDFVYVPDNDDINKCSFIANKIVKEKQYFLNKQKTGEFENVEKINWDIAGQLPTDTMGTDRTQETSPYLAEQEKSPNARLFAMYECYSIEPDEITGQMTHYVINICGGEILRKYKNPWGRRPFGIYVIDFGVNNIEPESFVDWIKDIQDIKTTIVRQWLDNLIKVNNIRPIIDPEGIGNGGVKLDSFLKNSPGSPYYAKSQYVDFQSSRIYNIGGDAIQGIKYCDEMIQEDSGINKYVQGQQSSSLNKTATGIRALLNQSQKRIRMIIRLMVETGFNNLLHTLTEMFKYTGMIYNEDTYLESENGMGYTDDESEINKYMALQPLYMQAMAQNPQYIIKFTKKMFEKFKLPYKDLFPPDEELNGQMGGNQQGMEQLMAKLQGGQQQEQAPQEEQFPEGQDLTEEDALPIMDFE